MDYIFKTRAAEEEQERAYVRNQDALLARIRQRREDYPGLKGITQDDETVVLWFNGPIPFDTPPRNLLDLSVGMYTGDFVLTFFPFIDDYDGGPMEDCGS